MSKKRFMMAMAVILLLSVALGIVVNTWLSEAKQSTPKNLQIIIKSKSLVQKLAYYKNKFRLKRSYA
jgi:hypothetical protein